MFKPRLIAQDTILSLPKTLGEGGEMDDGCPRCSRKSNLDSAIKDWKHLAETYKERRRDAELLQTKESVSSMREAQEAFESKAVDCHILYMSPQITPW